MANAKIDDNRQKVGSAIDTNNIVQSLRTDPVTGRLEIEIYISSDTVPGTVTRKRDGNYVPVNAAVGDDATAAIIPLIIDTSNGYLFVDVLVEP